MNSTARKKPTTCHFRNKCPARRKKCNNCVIDNHFANVCRKPKDPSSYMKPKPRVNNVEKEDDQTDDVNQISAYYDPDLESNHSWDEDNCVASVSSADSKTSIESINLPVVFGITATIVSVDSRSVCTIINGTLANSIVSQDSNSKWTRDAAPKQLKAFSNELIQKLGILETSIRSNNWYATPIEIQVVTDGLRSLLDFQFNNLIFQRQLIR